MFKIVPSEVNNRIFCCCVNDTNQIQIARITNIPNWHLEKFLSRKKAKL